MDFKKFWKETFGGFILKNILIAIAAIVALSWATLIYVDIYTAHGESETVPDLRGMYPEEARVTLEKQGLRPQKIDSVYVRGKKLGTIVEQIPAPNSSVKSNRAIYIIINSSKVRQINLPDVNDVSYRQADAMLQSVGLVVGSVEYAPSAYKDLVIDVKHNGRSIYPGTRIAEGSSVILVVGNGLGSQEISVPSIKALSLDAATAALDSASLNIGGVEYDVAPSGNESEYFIYRQRPAAGSSLPAGSKVDIFLTRSKARLNETFEEDKKNTESEEEFF